MRRKEQEKNIRTYLAWLNLITVFSDFSKVDFRKHGDTPDKSIFFADCMSVY